MASLNKSTGTGAKVHPKMDGHQRPDVSTVVEAFKARKGTNRHTALTVLARNFGKAIPRAKLLKAVYDTDDTAYVGALGMCLEGARKSIKKERLPFRIIKERGMVALVASH